MKTRSEKRTCWMCKGEPAVEMSYGYTSHCPECGGAGELVYNEIFCENCKDWVLGCRGYVNGTHAESLVCFICNKKL